MLYTSENLPLNPPTAVLADATRTVEASGVSILHHARLMWKQPRQFSAAQHLETTKNSDWLFHAFAKLVSVRRHCSPRLIVVEYGLDVEATKALVSDLGIGEHITWLPKMSRRELMWLLNRVSLGVGEFMNPRRMIWGGTGWEVLAAGKPLLQGFRFEAGEFEKIYGHTPPPLLSVRSQDDVLEGLLFATDYPERAAQMGRRAREWFDTHNGISLAKKWLKLVVGA
jgi:glycosyltransferase involved in cell wall biosynthesis